MRKRIVVLCLCAAVCLAGCYKAAETGGSVYEAGGNAANGAGDRSAEGTGEAAESGAMEGTGEAAESGAMEGTGEAAESGAGLQPGGVALTGGEDEYAAQRDELTRLGTAPLTGEYTFYDWSEEVKGVLGRYLDLGAALGKSDGLGPEVPGGIAMTMTPWEQGSLESVDGTGGKGSYRMLSAVISRDGGQSVSRAFYLEKENSAVWNCSLPGTAYDSLALKWVPEAAGGQGRLYLMTAQDGLKNKTEIDLWMLDGAIHGQVMCDGLCTRQLGGQRIEEALISAGEGGFTVTGTTLKGGEQADYGLDVKLGLGPDGTGFSLIRQPERYEAELQETPDYGLLLGLAGETDLRTLWVAAGTGAAEAGGVAGAVASGGVAGAAESGGVAGAAESGGVAGTVESGGVAGAVEIGSGAVETDGAVESGGVAGAMEPGSGAGAAASESGSGTAAKYRLVCRELPDVVARWTGDGMETVRYLNYRSGLVSHRNSYDAVGHTQKSFDWQFLVGQELPDRKAVERYAVENYQWFDSLDGPLTDPLDGYLNVSERLELVGGAYASAVTYSSYWGGGSGSWSNVNAFLSPIDNLLQENSHLSANDLKEMTTNDKSKIRQEINHYTKVYKPRVVREESMAIVSQHPLADSVYLARKEGKTRAVLPVAQLAELPNGSAHMQLLPPLYLDVDVPSAVTGYDKLYRGFDQIRYYIPDAVDAVSAPGGSMLAVETDRELLVFVRPNSLEDLLSPALSIPLYDADGEQIVSASWVEKKDLNKAMKAVEKVLDSSVYMGFFDRIMENQEK